MVPAKAGTAYGAAYWRHGSWRHASDPPSAARPCGGTQSLKVRNPSRHAIRPDTQSVSPHPGGGPPARSGRRDGAANRRHGAWCRLRPARSLVPPNGAAQNRLAKARLKTGGGPAARRPDRAGGMVPPIGGTVWCRPIGRHGMVPPDWAARSTVPAKAGTVPGGAVLGSREQSADWRTVLAGRQIGIGDSPAWMRSLGMRSLGMRMSWSMRGLGMRSPGTRSLGMRMSWSMRSLGMRMSWSMRSRGMRVSGNAEPGNAEPGGNAESGDCPPADWPAEAVPPDRAAQNGAAFWQHLPPPDSAAASRAAGRLAGGKKLGGCSEVPRGTSQGRLGASWCRGARAFRCRGARASRPAAVLRDGRCRPAGMVPPGYGAAYWRRGSWRHGVAGRERCRAAWCLQLEARFRAGPSWCRAVWCLQLAARFRAGLSWCRAVWCLQLEARFRAGTVPEDCVRRLEMRSLGGYGI